MAIPPIIPNNSATNSVLSRGRIDEQGYVKATNRPTSGANIRDEFLAQGGMTPLMASLESFKPRSAGSREKPLIMRFPQEIASPLSDIPHVMQFKIYWRWENKNFVDASKKLKMEAQATRDDIASATKLILEGNWTVEDIMKNKGTAKDVINVMLMLDDPNFTYALDPSSNGTLYDMLNNPETMGDAARMLERNVKSAENRVSSISEDMENPDSLLGTTASAALSKTLGVSSTRIGATELSSDSDVLSNRFNKQVAKGYGADKSDDGKSSINDALGYLNLQQRDPQYDQMVSIYLPVCSRINGDDAFSYDDKDMKLATGIMAGLNSFAGADSFASAAQKGMEVIKQSLGAAIMSSGADERFISAMGQYTGMVMNPRIEKLFQQKDIRNFTFSWDLWARNQAEVDNIKNIIDVFRYHSSPSKSSDGDSADPQIMLRVPAEYTIKFISSTNTGFAENEYIPKISRCVMTGIGVDYTPNGVFATIGPDNSPVAYSLTLSFSEIAQLTREDLAGGY